MALPINQEEPGMQLRKVQFDYFSDYCGYIYPLISIPNPAFGVACHVPRSASARHRGAAPGRDLWACGEAPWAGMMLVYGNTAVSA